MVMIDVTIITKHNTINNQKNPSSTSPLTQPPCFVSKELGKDGQIREDRRDDAAVPMPCMQNCNDAKPGDVFARRRAVVLLLIRGDGACFSAS